VSIFFGAPEPFGSPDSTHLSDGLNVGWFPGANTDLLMPLVLEVWQHDVKKLMEDILHHVGCVRSVNHGINYVSTGAGFLPSAVMIGNI